MIERIRTFRVWLAHRVSELAAWILPHGEPVPRESGRHRPAPAPAPAYPEGWGPADDPCGFVPGK